MTNTTDLPALRSAYEAWATGEGYKIDRESDGETYKSPAVHCGWHAYQAALASQPDDECSALTKRLADLLDGVAVALRGDPGPLRRWSWHDLPERVAALAGAPSRAGGAGDGLTFVASRLGGKAYCCQGAYYDVGCDSDCPSKRATLPSQPEVREALPPIKGAWIDGGYVIVTPAGSGPDKAPAVKAAILAHFGIGQPGAKGGGK